MTKIRGYFGIGISHVKTQANVGTLYRTAASMGASFVFTVGARFPKQSSDTQKSWKHIPALELDNLGQLNKLLVDCELVGVEFDTRAKNIRDFTHFERACYLLGAEDYGLSPKELSQCHRVVQLPGSLCHNVAVAGAMVMFDRWTKLVV